MLNDSTIILLSIIDSIKPWDSTKFIAERNANRYGERVNEMKLYWNDCDSILLNLSRPTFYFPKISQKTFILFLNAGGDNDTLIFECKKNYNNMNVYSFVCNSCRAYDSGYRAFFCDGIGVIAIYSGPWNNVSILDKIFDSEALNDKLQIVKTQLLNDSLFFPYANECRESNKVIYTPPIIIE